MQCVKTEAYSWLVSSELEAELKRQARLRDVSVSAIVDSAARNWLQKNTVGPAEAAQQRRLHRMAARCIGVPAAHNPRRAETARELIRQHLGRRYAR
jgi:hypothetical protein